MSNHRDFGPTIDLWIKLKIILEARYSDHDLKPLMIKFCEFVLIPHLVEMKQLPRQATKCLGFISFIDFIWASGDEMMGDKFLYLYKCLSQKNQTIFYYVLLMIHNGLLSSSIKTIMVIIAQLEA